MAIPNISSMSHTTALDCEEVTNVLLTSIALQGIGLSSIVNAGGEKIERILDKRCLSIHDALKISNNVDRMLRNIIKDQMLLQFELEDAIGLEAGDIIEPEEEVCHYFDRIS